MLIGLDGFSPCTFDLRPNDYPCLCLKRGFFLLITNSTPFLRTILQSTLLFLMEALTFICLIFIYECLLFIPKNDSPSGQVIWTHLYTNFITG